jgi:tape measure domain-containing protein
MAYAGKLTYKTELDTSGVQKAGSTVKSIIAGLGITKMISMAMNQITNSIDGAISRYDTLNNFPKVMSNLGIASEEADKSIKKMSDKLSGLPTTLDQGASAVQRFTSANSDVEKSTDIFLALNNAILAGGASTDIQASALEQLSQAYAKGKPDMMEWRTAMTAMPAQLKQVATAMGYVSTDELGESLRNGTVSMDEFMDTIIQLNEQGLDGFANFEEQARNSTGGIATSITVAKTQITKGVTDIIDSINKGLQDANLPSISEIITMIGKNAKEVLDAVASKLPSVISFIKEVYSVIQPFMPIIEGLAVAILAIVTAYTAYQKIVKLVTAVQTALNIVLTMNPIGLIIVAIGALIAIFVVLYKKSDKFRNVVNELFKTIIDAVKSIWDAIKPALEQLWKAIQNIWEALQPVVNFLIDVLITHIKTMIEVIKFLIPVISEVINYIIKGATMVINFYTAYVKKVIEIITTIIGYIVTFASNVIKLFNNIKTKIGNAINSIINFIISIPSKIASVPSKILSFFSSLPNKLMNIGLNIVKGIGNGITSGIGWIKSKIEDFVGNVTYFIKKMFKIGSPSKLMEDEIGQWIPKGIAVGVDANTDSVTKAMDDMYKEMNKTIKMENAKLNYDTLSGDVYNKSFFQTPVAINVKADVEMDSQKVGRLVTPSVTRTIKNGGGI